MSEAQAANITLMRLILESPSPEQLDADLAGHPDTAVRDLWHRHRQAFFSLKQAASVVDHGTARGTGAVERIAAGFDSAARICPEASVALYSLGDADELAEASREIVDWIKAAGLLAPGRHILDLGCGIGRLAGPLAAAGATYLGVDVSAEMVRIATERNPQLAFRRISGAGLPASLGGSCFDRVLAVDVFPYLVAAGQPLVRTFLADCRRVLAPGGELVIFNYAYDRDPPAARDELAQLAAASGYRLLLAGAQPFRAWDGRVFRLALP
jgi:SAM-dependent methyltransferase